MEVRHARAAEIAACRLLLAAEHPPTGRGERFLVAMEAAGAGSRLVGAAVFVHASEMTAGIRLRVIRPARRQGIGSSLVRALLAEARAHGSRHAYLAAWRRPDDEEVAPFLARFGFQQSMRIVQVEADVQRLDAYYRELCRRLRERGRIPDGARVVPLQDAPREAVLQLIASRLQERDEPGIRVARTVQHSRYDECPVVLTRDGVVAGVLLWEIHGEQGEIPVRVVAAGYEGSWVNPLLLARATEQSFEHGIARIRFDIPEGNLDTERLAARYHAVVTGIQERYELELQP